MMTDVQKYAYYKQLPLEDFVQKELNVIAIPLPPSPVGGLLYDPGCYTSDTFDKIFEHENILSSKDFECVAMTPTNQGPVFFMKIPIKHLLKLQYDLKIKRNLIEVIYSAFCASIEIDILNIQHDFPLGDKAAHIEGYANKVRLTSMRLSGRSCHGGSHLIVPNAPHITALLQNRSAPDNSDESRVAGRYGRPFEEEVSHIFPTASWGNNHIYDQIISEGFVCNGGTNSAELTIFSKKECIGDWAIPYLRKLARNLITPLSLEKESHGDNRIQLPSHQTDSVHSAPEVRNPISQGLSITVG